MTAGQTLYVTDGRSLVQARDHDAVELHAGDVVYAPDGEEHWHGATPDDFMTHLSITEGAAHWGLHVTDEEYHASIHPDGGRSMPDLVREGRTVWSPDDLDRIGGAEEWDPWSARTPRHPVTIRLVLRTGH